MKGISSRVVAHFLSITLLSCIVEGKCKCVNYNRDWYVVVCSFVSGLVLCAILVCFLNWYCRRCGGIGNKATNTESREALEMQNGIDFNPFYEEVPGQGDHTSEETGSFKQHLGRSESMESRISLFALHGEPSNLGDYQHPRNAAEPIYSNCGGIEGGSDGQSGLEEHGWASEYGESASKPNYQHLRSVPSAFEPELYKNHQGVFPKDHVSIPGNYQEPKRTYNGSKIATEATQDSTSPLLTRSQVILSKPPRYTKPLPKSRKIPPNYQTPSLTHHASRTTIQTPPSGPSPPYADCQQPKVQKKVLSESVENLEDGKAAELVPSTEENPPVASISQPSSPKMSQNGSNENHQFQEMDIKFPESKNIQAEPLPSIISAPPLCKEDLKRASNYQIPEIHFKFLENEDMSLIQPSSSSSSTELKIESPGAAPLPSSKTEPPSSSPSALPSRTPSPTAGSTVVSESSPPASPSEPLPMKSPEIPPRSPTKQVGPPIPPKLKSPDSRPPPPPPTTPPPKSPEIPSLQSTTSLPFPSKAIPPPPPPSSATTKPSSASSSFLYAELNELDRQDDTENYQHLTSVTKQ